MDSQAGKLFTSSPSGLKNLHVEADIWQITRGKALISTAIMVRGLAPSNELFAKYLNKWKHLHPEQWWNDYKILFQKEMESDEKIANLRSLYKILKAGRNVVLLCFCEDPAYCHRRLVGEFFSKYNINIIELNPLKNNIFKPQQLTII
jgi:uncharacterized protein YeaO (DUF488 family)